MIHGLQSVLIMFVASVILGWFTMTIILTKYKTNNLNKLYGTLLMGFLMGIVELLMMWTMSEPTAEETRIYSGLFLFGVITSAFLMIAIRKQLFVNERQFLLNMKEHHAMALVMSEQVKPKIRNSELCTLANNILTSQTKEIDDMDKMIGMIDHGSFTRDLTVCK